TRPAAALGEQVELVALGRSAAVPAEPLPTLMFMVARNRRRMRRTLPRRVVRLYLAEPREFITALEPLKVGLVFPARKYVCADVPLPSMLRADEPVVPSVVPVAVGVVASRAAAEVRVVVGTRKLDDRCAHWRTSSSQARAMSFWAFTRRSIASRQPGSD